MVRLSQRLVLALALAASAANASTAPDPLSWLEEVHGQKALDWVADQNRRAAERLETDPRFEPARKAALAIFTARDRLAIPDIHGAFADNLWQDEAHPHGLWRRAALSAYVAGAPVWTTLLDLDALSKAEGKSYFFKGASCLKPLQRLCLVQLSEGGGDAVEIREYDTDAKSFVAGGFDFPRAKQSAAWIDRDHVVAAAPLNASEVTRSGYPDVVRLVRRGSAPAAAKIAFRGEPSDGGGVRTRVLTTPDGTVRALVFVRSVNGEHQLYFIARPNEEPSPLPVPARSQLAAFVADQLVFTLQEDWRQFKSGDVVALDLAPGAAPRLVFHPTARQTVDQVRAAGDRLLIALLDNVRGRLMDLAYTGGQWVPRSLPIPDFSTVDIRAASDSAPVALASTEGFLTPTTLWRYDGAAGDLKATAQTPARFDASGEVVEQLFATSKDGTQIPYFVVRPKGLAFDGAAPTLMFGYGGFLISESPAYKPELGKLWLERGGVYVLANIRGGGEFGPAWHDAALRERRQTAFDDFAAIARDLFKRKITSPGRLGIYGRSNGGVLTSVSMTQHPELFRAVVIESPLIDMLRYAHLSAGASWISEYGDPDTPADRAFIEAYSAYQALKPGVDYPEPYITTNTEDDRVHPGHARKFAAKLQALGAKSLYFENTFGGHANDAAPDLNARRWARHYVYLMQKLMD